MSEEHLVFVYGTLRKGYQNHHLLAGARDLGPARTVALHALYLDDYPYLVKGHAVCRVVGELYGVDDAGLARLDLLEEHPVWYCREKVTVEDRQGIHRKVWVYFFPRPKGRLLASGDLHEAGDY
ncbi:MAG: gamma-glutamylcyclotransferase family protein [Pseudomonadota bacterium]